MSALPDITTPEALAELCGWSARRVRKLARGLGACHILGNRMILLPEDIVVILKAAKPNLSIDDVRDWLAADAAEILQERAAQDWVEPSGHVYFVKRGEEVKIGFTTDITNRLSNLNSGSSVDLTVLLMVPGTPALERYFHSKFAADRIGREWFRLADPVQEFIARRRRTMRDAT